MMCASLGGCARPSYVSQEHAALQTPVPIGDGDTGKPSLASLAHASRSAPVASGERELEPKVPSRSALPDPEPQPTTAFLELLLRYCDQQVHWMATRRVEPPSAVTLPTRMGRFTVELGIGHELLERARFDFPLLGAEPPTETALGTAPQFASRADVSRVVRVAERPRATWARITDRATGEVWQMAWPPSDVSEQALPLEAASSGVCPSGTEPD